MYVSVSNLQEFRRYRDHDELSFADLMLNLRGQKPPTDKMLAGRALHSVLETCEDTELTTVECDGITFTFKMDGQLTLAPIREMRGHRDYQVSGETVRLAGRVDSLDGKTVTDYKLSGQFEAERYADSYQWRAYLSIFGAQRFTYNVFVGKQVNNPSDTPEWTIYDLHTLRLYRYPELEADLVHEIGEYVAFAREHLLTAA
jgi:hypothetical protein